MDLNMINMLPNDLIEYIWKFVNKRVKVFLSKKYYNEYNSCIDGMIIDNRLESYIRDIVRKDYLFSFKAIFYRNIPHWLSMTNYPYSKDMVFNNYISFIKFYAGKNSSTKCYNFLDKNYKSDNLKSHKHKSSKNIKWKN